MNFAFWIIGLPLMFRITPGNIKDISTITRSINDLDVHGIDTDFVLMDADISPMTMWMPFMLPGSILSQGFRNATELYMMPSFLRSRISS